MNSRGLLFGLAAFSVVSVSLVGCGSGDSGSAASSGDGAGVSGTGEVKGAIEVAAFKGGFGIDQYQSAAQAFEAAHPGVKVKVDGDPRIWEKLRTRLQGGDAPDLMLPGWGMDHWALAEEGVLEPLDAALESPAADGKTKWADTFEPSILPLGKLNGKQYVLPYYFNVMGWWYDPGVFKKNGWTAPKTYADLLALAPKIKAKGMAPITFQGQYPYYMLEGMLFPWTYSIGGEKAVKDIQNLEPGAWKSAAVLKAVTMIDELNQKGFFQAGATGLSHTQSQQAFLEGKAAMIPCGTWLETEMKNTMPPGVTIEFMLPPVADGGAGDPTGLLIGIEPWMVPAEAKNKDGAIALFKSMTSLEQAKKFVEAKGTLMAIKGSDAAKLPTSLVKPNEAFKASKHVWSNQFRQWYPALEKEVEDALTALLNKELTPQKFCDRVEEAAAKTLKDDSITKHKL